MGISYFKLTTEDNNKNKKFNKKIGIRKEMFGNAPYVLVKSEDVFEYTEIQVSWISYSSEKENKTTITEEFLGGLPEGIEKVSEKYYRERVNF